MGEGKCCNCNKGEYPVDFGQYMTTEDANEIALLILIGIRLSLRLRTRSYSLVYYLSPNQKSASLCALHSPLKKAFSV